jgi:DNA-binding NarL/FixJ family response regulator
MCFVVARSAEHLASLIPNATVVVVDGDDHVPYVGDSARIVDEVATFLTGTRRSRARPPKPGVVSSDDLNALTAAGYRVGEAVAEGLTNPQIASALHLSRHTVESHLKRIYAKLGVTRVELAALIVRGPHR